MNDEEVTHFSGQLDGEIAEIMITKHWIVLVSFFSKILGISLFIVFFDIYIVPLLNVSFRVIVLIHLFVLSILMHLVAVKLINYFLRVIVVTNYRIMRMDHTIVFKRDRETMNLNSIQDISFMQSGLIQRLLGYGKIRILGASSEVIFHLHYIPRVSKYCNMIAHVFRKYTHRELPDKQVPGVEPLYESSLEPQSGLNSHAEQDQFLRSHTVSPFPGMKPNTTTDDQSSFAKAVEKRTKDFSFPNTHADSNAPGEN